MDYAAWHRSKADRGRLGQYLTALSRANPARKASTESKLAFWINTYNSLTIHGILREYPTSSIRNHTARFVGYNIWKDLKLYVGDRAYSLEQFEHETLRKMHEPRIHFAIVCASIGCPRLLNRAYMPQSVFKQLDANARDFFRRRQNFRYDASSGTFHLSSILDWFGSDFGDSRSARLRAISQWLPDGASRQAAERGVGRMSFLEYNWKLNDLKRRTARSSRAAHQCQKAEERRIKPLDARLRQNAAIFLRNPQRRFVSGQLAAA